MTKKQPAAPTSTAVYKQYAEQVVAEQFAGVERTNGEFVILACQRFLDDLRASESPSFPYKFVAAKAERFFKFAEALPHIKGSWASRRELIVLEPWQKFIGANLFGWVEKRDPKRYRFHEAYIEVARKNAKSTLAAIIGLFKFCADKEHGAEVYSGATTEKQAWEVFRPARLMAKNTPELCRAFGIKVGAKNLSISLNNSRFEPLIGQPGDGASPSCAIVDEYHEHKTDVFYDTMKTGMGARDNPLLLVITTAGKDRSGPCYALRGEMINVLRKTVKDERRFAIIYTSDKDDDWKSMVALQKANPNMGVSVGREFLITQQRQAIQSARKQNIFKTKHEDVWCSADVSWMNMAQWEHLADPSLQLRDFLGYDCDIALDLASLVDIAAKVRVFRRYMCPEHGIYTNCPDTCEGAKRHFYVFGDFYLNQRAVDEGNTSHYQGWAHEGKLIVTPGNRTDYTRIKDDLIQDSKDFIIREIPHDPYHAAALVQFIQKSEDWPQEILFVEFRQTVQFMSPAMKELEAVVKDGRLHHNGCPILSWMMSNVVCHTDAKSNIFPRKEREENKIDGAVALMMALARATEKPDGPYRESIFDGGSFWGTNTTEQPRG